MFCFFGHEACGILAPQPGIELALEVLTTGPPGKSLEYRFLNIGHELRSDCHISASLCPALTVECERLLSTVLYDKFAFYLCSLGFSRELR